MGFRKCKCSYCGEYITSEEDKVTINKTEKTKVNVHKHCEKAFLKELEDKKIENDKWTKLYDYVKYNILNYKSDMNLTPNMVRKLQSLRSGEIVNKGHKLKKDGYDYEVILLTFKVKKVEIESAIFGKIFTDENHKFNYIMVIVCNGINDVYTRIEKQKKESEKEETLAIKIDDNVNKQYEEYKQMKNNKPKNKLPSLLEDLF